MPYQTRKNASGLLNNVNKFNAPPGALAVGDNAIINSDEEVAKRQGFDKCATGLPATLPEKLFVHNGTLYLHTNGNLYFKDGSCTYNRIVGFGISAEFNGPFAIWSDSSFMYVSDSLNNTIRKIDLNSLYVSTYAGLAGAGGSANGIGSTARFRLPIGIWGNATDLYTGDVINDTIRKIVINTANVSTYAGLAGNPGSTNGVGAAARFDQPSGVWGNATDLYIADGLNSIIRKIDIATATVTTFAGTAGINGEVDGVGAAARFDEPIFLWGNATDLYVTDFIGQTIRKIDIATATVTTFAGTAYAAGSTNGIGAAARFNGPIGIWGNATDLYVADFNNQIIRSINLGTSNVATIAGGVGISGYVDGIGSIARFNQPYGVFGIGSDLYICDSGNNIIRKLNTINNNVTTFAGTPLVAGFANGYVSSTFQGPT